MFTLPPRSVLVPIDFSDRSLEAARMAADMLPEGGELHVIYVLDELSAAEPGVVWGTIDDASRKLKATGAAKQALEERGVTDARISVDIASGNPAYRIAERAKELGVEMVMLPSHGRTGLARLALGSVAERVVRLAPCPVLVLRGPRHQPEKA